MSSMARTGLRRTGAPVLGAALLVSIAAPAGAQEMPAYTESVEVEGRLGAPGEDEPAGAVRIYTREEIRASGARSLPEFLATLPEISAADETGNGRQLSIDL